MIKNLKAQRPADRDGTTQEGREQQALSPDYVNIEDRSKEALIAAAQRLARVLKFNGEGEANWEALLLDEMGEYRKKLPQQQQMQRRKWARELAAYLQDPGRVAHDPDQKALLGRPQVALFLTFLRLLDHLKEPLNGLVKKKLDFYYRQRLQLVPKDAVPDVVHVLVDLAAGVESHSLAKGTLLQAGKDESGNELMYATDHHTVISRAQITALKTIFLEKETIILKQLARDYPDHPEATINRMLELALGDPEPGDPLPAFPDGIAGLKQLVQELKAGHKDALNYVSEQLCMSNNDFLLVMDLWHHPGAKSDHDPDIWKALDRILANAHLTKVKKRAKSALRAMHQADEVHGFDDLLEYVFGRSEQDGRMPDYKGKAPSLHQIFDDLTNLSELSQQHAAVNRGEALEYIRYDLALSEKNFVQLAAAYKNPETLTSGDWDRIYTVLEASKRKIQKTQILLPKAEKWLGIYAEQDTKAAAFSRFGGDQELLQFRVFGGGAPKHKRQFEPARLGWAIRSPMLFLAEGIRKITLTITLHGDQVQWKALQNLWDTKTGDFEPFRVELTTEEGWLKPANVRVTLGNFLLGNPEFVHTSVPTDQPFPMGELGVSDKGKYLVGKEERLFRIDVSQGGFPAAQHQAFQLISAGQVNDSPHPNEYWSEYHENQVYHQALKAEVQLDETDLPVTTFVSDAPQAAFTHDFPAVRIILNQKQDSCPYQYLAGLTMGKVHLGVAAADLQEYLIQNDSSFLDPKKPFHPFGDTPVLGDSCYLAHPEITQKRLDTLGVDWDWMNVPSDFKEYYQNYWRVTSGKPELEEDSFDIQNKDDFKIAVSLKEGRSKTFLSEEVLFPDHGKTTIGFARQKGASRGKRSSYHQMADAASKTDILDWDRYFKLELAGNDFQHQNYPLVLNKQMTTVQQELVTQLKKPEAVAVHELAALAINPPYTPKLKSLSLSYTAHTEIVFGEGKEEHDEIFHLHPFGYERLDESQNAALLPAYQEEGELFIGLEGLARPQILSMLFQVAEGSGDADSEKPELKWSYLDGNAWIPFEKAALLSDTTNGLLNSGIIRLELPETKAVGHTLMPADQDWLKVSCLAHRSGVPDIIDIHTQAISATLHTTKVASSHFLNLLAPASISAPVSPISAVKGFKQPFSSRRGRPEEADQWFNTRVSERLRHKNRALTTWDYEHMILEQFPEVRKVKCLQGDISGDPNLLGCVTIIVIADIRSKMPVNPFEPKISVGTINQIKRYVAQWSPAYTTIKVVNPVFLQVKAQIAVKFREGYDPGYYLKQVEQDVKHFLAPWAYEGNNNITLGGKMYASGLVNYLMKKPYVAFLGRLALFQREEGERFVEARMASGTKGLVRTSRPDMAIVSAQSHEISVLSEEDLKDEDATGVNHMMIEQDLIIHKKLVVSPGAGNSHLMGVGNQIVGVDLIVGANP